MTYYNTGTASVAAGSAIVTFTGAILGTAEQPMLMPGDLFCSLAQPLVPPLRISSIDFDAGKATLASNWPGTAMVNAPYEVQFIGDIARSTAQTRRYLEALGQLGSSALALRPFAIAPTPAGLSAYTGQPVGTIIIVSNVGDGRSAYYRLNVSGSAAVWEAPVYLTGPKGDTGDKGWAPVFALVADGARYVLQVADWVGGQGSKPTVGQYLGPAGLVSVISSAVNVRGQPGASGNGSGDVVASANLSDLANKQVAADNLSLKGANIASAATVNLDAATGSLVTITGTVQTTAFTLATGSRRRLVAAAAWSIKAGANVAINGAASGAVFTCDPADEIEVWQDAAISRVTVHRASGKAVVPPTFAEVTTKPTTLAGYGITDATPRVSPSTPNAVARFADAAGTLQDSGIIVTGSTGGTVTGVVILTVSTPTGSVPTTPARVMIGEVTSGTNGVSIRTNGSTALRTMVEFENPNGVVGSISVTGSATTYATSSDYRLKQDIAPLVEFVLDEDDFALLPDSLLRIMAVRPVQHKWKADPDGPLVHGVIAHELQQVLPHAVTGEKDAVIDIGDATLPAELDEQGEPLEPQVLHGIAEAAAPDGSTWVKTGERITPQGVDYSKLVVDLTAAVQSLTLIVLEQQRRLDE